MPRDVTAGEIGMYGVSETQNKKMAETAQERARSRANATYKDLSTQSGIPVEELKRLDALRDVMNILIEEYLADYASATDKGRVTALAHASIDRLNGTPGIGGSEVRILKDFWNKIANDKSTPTDLDPENKKLLIGVLEQKGIKTRGETDD